MILDRFRRQAPFSVVAAALAGAVLLPAAPAGAQSYISGAGVASETCETGVGDLEGMLEASQNVAAEKRQQASREIDAAKAAQGRRDWNGCLVHLENALNLLGDTDGMTTN